VVKRRLKIAIIGAGPAGMTAAYLLAKGGAIVEVYESTGYVGGLARSFTLWDQRVDLGPHRFFSSDQRVNSLWKEVVGNDYAIVKRQTRIYYKKKFFDYPLRPLNALLGLGIGESLRCASSYVLSRLTPQHCCDNSFENWVVRRFGKRLFEIFFKTYSEKLWGIPCKELDSDFAAQRIRKLSLKEAVINALFPKTNKHRTLMDAFAYPLHGTGMTYERMADRIRSLGGRIHLSCPVTKLHSSNNKVIGLEFPNRETAEFDYLISTMPLTLLVNSLGITDSETLHACSQLQFRNTTLVYLLCDSSDVFPDQWIYIHSPELQTGRVTNFRNWVPQLYGNSPRTILCMEYWSQDDGIWTAPPDEVKRLAREEIQSTGLVSSTKILDAHVVRINRCYPIYRRGYSRHVATIANSLNRYKNLQAIGRYGSFKYNNQDHSILMGILASENILSNANHNLWSVNSDYDTYQEASNLSQVGLENFST